MPHRAFTLIIALLSLGIADRLLAEPPRRYDLEPGQKATYLVEVEFSDGETTWKLSGTPNYTVISLIDGAAEIRFQGTLDRLNGEPIGRRPAIPFSGFDGIYRPPGRSFASRQERHITFRVNDRGEVLRTVGNSRLPYLIGELHEIILVALPEEAADRWRHEAIVEIAVPNDGALGQYMRGSTSRIVGGHVEHDSEQTTRLAAVETVEYGPGEDGGYRRSYWLRTKEETVGSPRVELKTEGLVRFSDDGFLPEFVEFSGKLVARDGLDQSGRIMRITAKRLTAEDLAKRAERAKQAREESKQQVAQARMKAAEQQKQAYEQLIDDLDELVADLKSGDESRIREAASRLAGVTGETPDRPELATALHEALDGSEWPARSSLGKALAKWATPKQTNFLIDLLDEEDIWTRRAAMEALGTRKDEKAIPALAARLGERHDTRVAIEALKQYGAAAENAVLKQLGDKNWADKRRIVLLLGEIGTKKSLPILKKLAANAEYTAVRHAAEQAFDAIESRLE